MAIPGTYCTPVDLRNLSEYISTEVRDNGRIKQFQLRADSIIRDALRPIYPIESGLYETTPWNGPPLTPFALPDDDISANTGTGSLLDITINSTADATAIYTVTLGSGNAFTVSSDVEGSQGSGSTGSNFTTSNGDITIPSANWSGSHTSGDTHFVSVYRAKPLIVSISALLSAGLMLKSVNESAELSEKGDDFYSSGFDLLLRLQRPYEDTGLQLDSFTPRDITPEGVQYSVDHLGRDVGKYADNEATPWTDSTPGGYGFYYGPIWLKYWG